MRKIIYLFASLIMVALVGSCSKETTYENEVGLKVATISMQSFPISDGKITPVILAVDKPRGGNVTCTDVAQAYFTSFDICGDKLNYGDFDFDGDKEFNGSFPLNVTVEGVYVSFSTDGGNCILIGEKYYKVGAVIVKGSNASNVYYYPNGTLEDSGLASPINSSGSPAGLSNLTFCFIECSEPLVVAIKSWYWTSYDFENNVGTGRDYTMSSGSYPIDIDQWCDYLGVNDLKASSFPLLYGLGTVTIEEGWPEGIHSWIITVDLNDGMVFERTSLYVGSLSGLTTGALDSFGCPNYYIWPYQSFTKVNTHVFTVPY